MFVMNIKSIDAIKIIKTGQFKVIMASWIDFKGKL